jgi:hypothetical protein
MVVSAPLTFLNTFRLGLGVVCVWLERCVVLRRNLRRALYFAYELTLRVAGWMKDLTLRKAFYGD